MMEHVPLYLDGSLSYISSRNFRPSPLTLEPLDPILNTASILLPFILSPPRALSSRQVLCLLAAFDTSLSRDPFVCEDSRSLLSPRRPLHLYYSVTQFFTYSSSSSFFTSSFSYTLLLSQSSVNTVIGVRPATLHSKQPRG